MVQCLATQPLWHHFSLSPWFLIFLTLTSHFCRWQKDATSKLDLHKGIWGKMEPAKHNPRSKENKTDSNPGPFHQLRLRNCSNQTAVILKPWRYLQSLYINLRINTPSGAVTALRWLLKVIEKFHYLQENTHTHTQRYCASSQVPCSRKKCLHGKSSQ